MNFNFDGISETFAYSFVGYLCKIIITLVIFGHFNKRIQKSIDKTSYGYKSAVYYWTIEIRKKVAEFFNCKYTRKDKVTETENNQWDLIGLTYGIVMISPAFILIPFTLALGYWGLKLGCPVNLDKIDSIWSLLDIFTKYGCFKDDIGLCLFILFIFCMTSLVTGIDFTFTDIKHSMPVIILVSLLLAGYDRLIFDSLKSYNIGWNKPLFELIYIIALCVYIIWRWVLAICWTFRRGDTNEVTGENEESTVDQNSENSEETVPLDEDGSETANSAEQPSRGHGVETRNQSMRDLVQSTQDILNVLRENGIDSYVGESLRRSAESESTSSEGDDQHD